jgi:hypothetical protein
MRKAPSALLHVLLAAVPSAAEKKDVTGRLALHWVLAYPIRTPQQASLAVALLEAYPGAAYERDAWSALPLHYAAAHQAPQHVLAALLAANPQAPMDRDSEGRLPLHCCAEKRASLAALTTIFNANPAAASVRDKAGRLPLHTAVLGAALHDRLPEATALVKAFFLDPRLALDARGRSAASPELYGSRAKPRLDPADAQARARLLRFEFTWLRRGPFLTMLAGCGFRPLEYRLRVARDAYAAGQAPGPLAALGLDTASLGVLMAASPMELERAHRRSAVLCNEDLVRLVAGFL